jgi:hypothetical protein
MMCSTGGQLVAHLGEQWDDRRVDDDHAVLGVIDHIRQLVGEQTNVEGVQHRTHARHGEVGLEMGLVVPHERADAIALLHAQPAQRGGELVARSATSANVDST